MDLFVFISKLISLPSGPTKWSVTVYLNNLRQVVVKCLANQWGILDHKRPFHLLDFSAGAFYALLVFPWCSCIHANTGICWGDSRNAKEQLGNLIQENHVSKLKKQVLLQICPCIVSAFNCLGVWSIITTTCYLLSILIKRLIRRKVWDLGKNKQTPEQNLKWKSTLVDWK